jgi:hypothetical protein
MMGTDPTAGPSITLDQVETWLKAIANGVIDLTRDNEGMAAAALGYIVPAWKPAPQPARKEP